MTIEKSHGKARPTLPRSGELRPAREAAGKPTGERDAHGHFAAGNAVGRNARFKHTIRKALGTKDAGATVDVKVVTRDAMRVFSHVLAALPSDAPPVRVLVSMHARHVALNAYFTAKAEEAGLTTPTGLRLLDVADRQSQRAERVLISAQDLARVCAAEQQRRQPQRDYLALDSE